MADFSMFAKRDAFGARMEIVDEMSKPFQEKRIDMKLISDAFLRVCSLC